MQQKCPFLIPGHILLDSTVHTHEEEDIQLEDFALNQVLVNNEGDDVNKQDPVIQKKVAALFLLKLKEIHKVSQTALLGIVDDINELVQHRIQSIEIEVMLYLSSNGVSQDICNELQKIFRAGQSISFLNTTYLQQKYYKEYLGLLVSTCLCMYVCIFGVYLVGLCNNRDRSIIAKRNCYRDRWDYYRDIGFFIIAQA